MKSKESAIGAHISRKHLDLLTCFANKMSGLFGGEVVYLVGSALQQDNDNPRDWDIRLKLSDEDFVQRYYTILGTPSAKSKESLYKSICDGWFFRTQKGKYDKNEWRYWDEMVRFSNKGRRETGLNIDFQVFPAQYFDSDDYKNLPYLRLDTRGADFPPKEIKNEA